MDLYQLSYFVKTVETRSLSRAAEALMITQPAVSRQIKALEDELGEKLFDRLGKKIFLTRAGEVLLTHAEGILRSATDAANAVKALSAECSGGLVIGTSDHISIHRLPGILKAFISAFPKVDLSLRCHRSETILQMIEENQLDLGVVTIPDTATNIIARTIWEDPMFLVFPKGHPLGSLKSIRLRDTVRFDMILPEKGTTTRNAVDAVYAKRKLHPAVAMEVAYLETIKGLVKAGLGVSILPETAIAEEVRAGILVKKEIEDATFGRILGAVYLKDKFLSRPAREFLKMLEQNARRVPGPKSLGSSELF